MNLDFYHVVTIEKTQEILSALAMSQEKRRETVRIDQSLGRFSANDLFARFDLPKFNRSTVDGYAIMAKDVSGSSESIPSIVEIVGEVQMGEHTHLYVAPSQAVYVPTGGMIPEGANAVVMIEYVEKLDESTLLVYNPVTVGENISFIGDDLVEGDLIIHKGTCISPYDIGLLVGMGIKSIDVYEKLRVSIISTGDEIIDLDKEASIGQVYDMNGYAVEALVRESGGIVVHKAIIQDDFDLLKACMDHCLSQSDFIIMSGGSSVGMRDYTKELIESFDESKIWIHGLAIKPGKPSILGTIGKKVVFGLPGHPVSALIVFEQLVGYYMESYYAITRDKYTVSARLTNNVHGSPGRDTFQMVRLEKVDTQWYAQPIHAKSGMMSLLAHSSGYFKISMNKEGCQKDELIEVFVRQGGSIV